MHCTEWERLLDAYLDGQLSGALRLEFDAHRLHCQHCQQTLAMMETIGNVITNDEQVPTLSVNFAERVMAVIQDRQRVIPWYRRRWVLATVGLANVAAAVIVAMVVTRGAPLNHAAKSSAAPLADLRGAVDPIDLADYIWTRYQAAQANVSSDLNQLAQIPLGLNVPEELNENALGGMLNVIAPGATEQAAADGETHSL